MSLTSLFQFFVRFEIDVLVCISIFCSVFKYHLHLSIAHLYYQILPSSSNFFYIFFNKKYKFFIFYCLSKHAIIKCFKKIVCFFGIYNNKLFYLFPFYFFPIFLLYHNLSQLSSSFYYFLTYFYKIFFLQIIAFFLY